MDSKQVIRKALIKAGFRPSVDARAGFWIIDTDNNEGMVITYISNRASSTERYLDMADVIKRALPRWTVIVEEMCVIAEPPPTETERE